MLAKIELAAGNPDLALEAHNRNEPALSGLAGVYLDSRDFLARAYRDAGRLEEAETTLKETLRVLGGHAMAHYQLGKVYEDMDRPDDARLEYETFLTMWSDADEGIAELVDARERLVSLGR